MKKLLLILLCVPMIGFGQNTVCFNIEPNPNPNDAALSPFTKYIDVLGRKAKIKINSFFIKIYDDGTVVKKIIID